MDFSQVGVAKTTSCDDFEHPEHGPAGITVHGITKAHEDYDKLVMKHNPPQSKQRVYLGDEQSVEMKNDPKAEARRRKVLAAMVTDIEGFTGWEYSPENVQELFARSDVDWLVNHWGKHLADEGKHSTTPESKPKRGQKSSAG